MSALLKLIKNSSASIKCSSLAYIPRRNIRTTPTLSWLNEKMSRFASSKKREEFYMEKDKVPTDSQLIYRNPIETYASWAVNISTLTASLITAAALFQYSSSMPIMDMEYYSLVVHKEDIYYFAAGFIALNSALRFIVSMMPLRIYKKNGKYLAIFYPQLPGLVPRHAFNQGEVVKSSNSFNPWNNDSYKLGTKTSIIFEDYFKTPSEFHEMARKKTEIK